MNQEISSAELTANYRCAFPELSGDNISLYLSSKAGKDLAEAFVAKYHYPLARRKISVCVGYFLQQADRLIKTGKYDSVISFASGFSLLVYLIAKKNPTPAEFIFYDTDFPHMIEERNKRISVIKDQRLDEKVLSRIHSMPFDIEQVYQQGGVLTKIFPKCQRPIFILDGVSYFLSKGCTEWLFDQMGSYTNSAVTLYYWPDNMAEQSSLFAKIQSDLNKGMIKEELKNFWGTETLSHFRRVFPKTTDLSLQEAEKILVNDPSQCQLLDPNTFFPIHLITGER